VLTALLCFTCCKVAAAPLMQASTKAAAAAALPGCVRATDAAVTACEPPKVSAVQESLLGSSEGPSATVPSNAASCASCCNDLCSSSGRHCCCC
jgi:hypothetical protein